MVMNVDGFEMVVAKLTRGTFLNHRNLCLDSRKMFLSVRCVSRATVMIMNLEQLNEFVEANPDLSRKLERYCMKLENENI